VVADDRAGALESSTKTGGATVCLQEVATTVDVVLEKACLWIAYIGGCALIARSARRSVPAWSVCGFFFGPLAMLTLLTLPPAGRPPHITTAFAILMSLGLVSALAVADFVVALETIRVGPGPDTGGPDLEFVGVMAVAALGTMTGGLAGMLLAPFVAGGRALYLARKRPMPRWTSID